MGFVKIIFGSSENMKELKKLSRLLTLETLYDEWDDNIGNIVPQ